MIIEHFSGEAMPLLGKYQEDSHSEEESHLLEVANGAVAFVYFTGQLYRFDEFRMSRSSGHPRASSFPQVTELLERIHRDVPSVEEKEILLIVMDALDFTVDMNKVQLGPGEEGLVAVETEAPFWMASEALRLDLLDKSGIRRLSIPEVKL